MNIKERRIEEGTDDVTISWSMSWKQSYKNKFSLKNTKLVFQSLMVHYFNFDHNNTFE